jgi:hypothetical protein
VRVVERGKSGPEGEFHDIGNRDVGNVLAKCGCMRLRPIVITLLASPLLLSCNRPPVTVSAAPVTVEGASVGTVAHGDHNPHHGGTVYMLKDLHYEVVLEHDGHHSVYFSDAARQDLPASVASSVKLTVQRKSSQPEVLQAVIDESGECWVAHGNVVEGDETTVRVDFMVDGAPYFIDVPFLARITQ